MCAVDESFDPEFYKKYYSDVSDLKDVQIANHWLSTGRREGRFPNDSAAVNFLLENNDIPSEFNVCLLYTSPSPRDRTRSRMPSSA